MAPATYIIQYYFANFVIFLLIQLNFEPRQNDER